MHLHRSHAALRLGDALGANLCWGPRSGSSAPSKNASCKQLDTVHSRAKHSKQPPPTPVPRQCSSRRPCCRRRPRHPPPAAQCLPLDASNEGAPAPEGAPQELLVHSQLQQHRCSCRDAAREGAGGGQISTRVDAPAIGRLRVSVQQHGCSHSSILVTWATSDVMGTQSKTHRTHAPDSFHSRLNLGPIPPALHMPASSTHTHTHGLIHAHTPAATTHNTHLIPFTAASILGHSRRLLRRRAAVSRITPTGDSHAMRRATEAICV